jgi:exodeoxyribonuclease-3
MNFKILTFNILLGGGSDHRFGLILDLIQRAAPDVIILQECLKWEDRVRLEQMAEAGSLPVDPQHLHLGTARPRGSGDQYHVVVASRLSMKNIQVSNNPFFLGHCIVKFQVMVNGQIVTIFGTHFDSHSENLRFVEARYLRSLLEPEPFFEGHSILAGDLNSLSLRDPYPPNFEALLRQSETLKYHLPPRFEVTQELESFGWVDSFYAQPSMPEFWVTAPRSRGGIQIDYRIDYVFVSPSLVPCLKKTEIIEAGEASDHNPVLATFEI